MSRDAALIALGALLALGAVTALELAALARWQQRPPQAADPAAYAAGELIEEARRITREAAP